MQTTNGEIMKNYIAIRRSEKGSLALEQVLFIGAVVAMASGLFLFYENISTYLGNVGFSASPTNVGAAPTP
jgi:hypothetical protein